MRRARTVVRRSVAAAAAAMAVVAGAIVPSAALPDPLPVPMRLTPVATGLDLPVALSPRPGSDTLYIVEQPGYIRALGPDGVSPTPVLDISDEVSTGFEQGLLGLAFDPSSPNYFYINYTDTQGHTHVVEYQMDGEVASPTSRRELFTVQQPFANHNGGSVHFGPDGYLYLGLGDGGSGGDPQGNGQNLGTLLGKMLRIDPRGATPYAIPADNPFVGVEGAREEIWAYGLRNPWQFSFDRSAGDLWIADVGQNLWEEINVQASSSTGGENYGWNAMEGTHPYEDGVEPENHHRPVYEYPHGLGCSITGGYVYRGSAIDGLQGTYLFGDFCAGRIWTLHEIAGTMLHLETGMSVPTLTAFGEDNDGELYAMNLAGQVFRIDPII